VLHKFLKIDIQNILNTQNEPTNNHNMSYNYNYPSQSERMVVPSNQALISNSSSSAFDRFGYRHHFERSDESSNSNYQSNSSHIDYRPRHQAKPITTRSIIYEPPRWACPGRGDSTLQVRLFFFDTLIFLRFQFINLMIFSTCSQ